MVLRFVVQFGLCGLTGKARRYAGLFGLYFYCSDLGELIGSVDVFWFVLVMRNWGLTGFLGDWGVEKWHTAMGLTLEAGRNRSTSEAKAFELRSNDPTSQNRDMGNPAALSVPGFRMQPEHRGRTNVPDCRLTGRDTPLNSPWTSFSQWQRSIHCWALV